MAVKVTSTDPRYETLKRSRNLRWPASAAEAAEEIELCETAEQVAEALQRIVHAGMRPTIRSGGHCYEDFVVNNPGGAILDLSLLTSDSMPGDGKRYRISPGQQLGEVYLNLYKRYGVTVPAGSCYTVGAGGHISGGGYGVLSRLQGLTVDWVSGIEVLTVDSKGDVLLRRIDEHHDADLFRACRGGGGGNFGVMTGFLFDHLPIAPVEVINGFVSFDWATMTEDKFADVLMAFGNYFATRGRDPDTWGLFSILELSHSSSGHFGFGLQFCNPDGRCDDVKVLAEFLDCFKGFDTVQRKGPAPAVPMTSGNLTPLEGLQQKFRLDKQLWLDAAVGDGSGGSERAQYKSCYMKQNFSRAEVKCIYKHLTATVPGVDTHGFVLAVDSYGGAVNAKKMTDATAVCQRSSILKLQFQQYWRNADEDASRLQWMRDFYTDLYSQHTAAPYAGTPYPGEHYEGCYINYPDKDMLDYAFWPQLYYGTGELYPFLQKVKQKYDPNNIFHHSMSVRA
jgi:FAD/FMN-containing dehydrogenase